MKRVNDCLKNFREKWSVFSWEENGLANMNSHLDSLNALLVDKIQKEMQMCKEQIQKIERDVRTRRIRAFFGLFSVNNKRVRDFEETLFDGLFSVALVIRIVLVRLFRFSARF